MLRTEIREHMEQKILPFWEKMRDPVDFFHRGPGHETGGNPALRGTGIPFHGPV